MPTPTTIDTDTELSAVNSILGAIGQSPVTTLGTTTEITGEVKYTGDNSDVTFSIVDLTRTTDSEVKVKLDGEITTAYSISGNTLTFTSAPNTNVAIRIYREKEVYNTYANPEVSFIYNILTEVNKDVQNEGWVFNLEEKVTKTPDAETGYITIPANVLRYDLHNNLDKRTMNLTRRNGRLYDLVNHTDVFTATLYLDLVTLYAFEDLPNPFQRYITYRAAVRAATQLVSNPQLAQLLKEDEFKSRAACLEYECDKADPSFFGNPHDSSYTAYQPYNALRR